MVKYHKPPEGIGGVLLMKEKFISISSIFAAIAASLC